MMQNHAQKIGARFPRELGIAQRGRAANFGLNRHGKVTVGIWEVEVGIWKV
jgi:hypothetical protein